ncbi:ABC transporter substrate-binding protein [Metabacillus sp. RGM 3146]|uniref:ABC transporter substrate-binding protein n=1 Tax=Metabacillus sp. RGM 3146 TaxID=3401092 RepID=UPI003B9C087D
MKKIFSALLTLSLSAGLLTACNTAENQKKTNENPSAETKEGNQAAFPLKIKDATGKEVTIKQEPKRIVSLIPSNTEVAYDLNLGKEIVGVSNFDNYPADVSKKEKVGDAQKVNVEKIIGLKPDLVLAHESSLNSSGDSLDQLKNAGISVVVVNDAETFSAVYQSIEMVGKATGKSKEAKDIIAKMKEKISSVKEKAKSIPQDKQKRVYVEISPSPDIYTAGKGTFIDEILTDIGAKNAAADLKGWAKISEEAAVKLNPDSIITTYGYYIKDPIKQVSGRKGWENVSAVKNKDIVDVNSDQVTRPGPRLAEGVEELAKVIYPDIYKK